MKKAIFWVVYIVFLFGVFCVGAEVVFRVFRKPLPSLHIITQNEKRFLLTPGASLRSVSSVPGEFDYVASVNRFGYRGEDFAMPRDPGRLRIFAVGDSFTFGVGAEEHETIPYLLQEKARKLGYDVEVVNAGIGHAGAARHYMNVRDIHLQYQPDLVVLLLDLTDLVDDWHAERHGIFDKDGELRAIDYTFVDGKRDWWRTIVQHSAFGKWFHNKFVRLAGKIRDLGLKNYVMAKLQGKRAKAVIISEQRVRTKEEILQYDSLLMLRGLDQKELIEEQWERTGHYILKIRDLLAERNIPLVLVMYPHGIYVGETQWHEGRKTWGFDQNRRYDDLFPFKLVERFAAANGIAFINTLDAFLLAEDRPYFFDWDGHMTPDANEIVARTIVLNPRFQQYLR